MQTSSIRFDIQVSSDGQQAEMRKRLRNRKSASYLQTEETRVGGGGT